MLKSRIKLLFFNMSNLKSKYQDLIPTPIFKVYGGLIHNALLVANMGVG